MCVCVCVYIYIYIYIYTHIYNRALLDPCKCQMDWQATHMYVTEHYRPGSCMTSFGLCLI